MIRWHFFLLICVACSNKSSSLDPKDSVDAASLSATVSEDASSDAQTAVDDASIDDAGDSDAQATEPLDPNAELRLSHGPCYGRCPELYLKLRADGQFTGRGAPKVLDPEKTRELFDLAAKAFNPPPRCYGGSTDVQYVTVTLVQNGKKVLEPVLLKSWPSFGGCDEWPLCNQSTRPT